MKKFARRAFSLIELSVVLLIIGILIAGVTQSSRLIRQFRLSAARSITQGSPVSSIRGLTLWYETTMEESIDDAETEDGAAVTNWHDINPSDTAGVDASSADDARPTYVADCFKSLPCLSFDGTDDYLNATRDLSFGHYALFVVVDTGSEGEVGYILHSIYDDLGSQGRIMILPLDVNNIMYSFRYIGSSDNFDISASSAGEVAPYIFEAYENSSKAAFLVNGTEKGSNTNDISPTASRNTKGFTIGAFHGFGTPSNFFSGKIAEIIFFNRALKNEERQAVVDYLNKKWK